MDYVINILFTFAWEFFYVHINNIGLRKQFSSFTKLVSPSKLCFCFSFSRFLLSFFSVVSAHFLVRRLLRTTAHIFIRDLELCSKVVFLYTHLFCVFSFRSCCAMALFLPLGYPSMALLIKQSVSGKDSEDGGFWWEKCSLSN